MAWPIIRSLPQDQQDGYTFDMGAYNTNLGGNLPAYDKLCNYLPPGPVFTQTLAPGAATVDYNIMNAHQGGCIVYLSLDNQKTWTTIGSDPKCGVYAEAQSKQGSIPVTLPPIPAGATKYNAIIRWTYTANNGGAPNEAFTSCADVVVAANGKNDHNNYLLLSQSESGVLPKDTNNYWDQSCQAGSFQCGADTRFISQCISLAASGSYGGGSSWYQYQCPKGTSCATSGSTAACK
ncbi:hypothetical protein BCR33DRAFT_761237 [Rhizoclosmatium globosum]|uniref:Chitin-binding type-4 domain-containing protein n=1 Tax=Rhizoclosmatium globosum TaxID=329046 RepID=A0A1Y2D160_9FUNG|nr:hypothetical protein BCR33DRAFT_761237 [Rhizoclosmatium globosum]|eukprot:ORY52876.1 hypothetical protein BCR33DRAFT_761237 [Rhizoclosmatium globosum]